MIASHTALLQLNVTGVWGVKVLTSASSLTTWVIINGQQVPINSTTQIGIFTAKAKGEREWEMKREAPGYRVGGTTGKFYAGQGETACRKTAVEER